MKKLFSLGLMLVALTLMNCSKEEIATEAPAVNGAAFELFASTEDGRTVNSGWNTQWAEGDEISVIHAENGTQDWVQDTPEGAPFTIADLATGRFTGTLQAELDAESYDWYLFYPYSKHMTTPANNPDNDPKGAYMTIGSAYNKTQTQTDNNNLTHIAGSDYPLYGKVTNVAVGEIPSVTMHHVSSLVEFNITNGSEEPITVQKIELTAPEYLIGTFYIDFSGETLSFKDSGPSYVSNTATLTVDGAALATGESAKFYMAVKPFALAAENELTIKVTTDAGICSKTITGKATTFKAGKVKTIGFNYEAPDEPAKAIPFEDTLDWLAGISSTNALTANELSENYISAAYVYKDGEALKIGSSDNRGSLTTTRFELNEPFVVVVRAKTYSSDSSKIKIQVGDVASTEQTLTGNYKFYTFAFEAQEAPATVTINVTGKRGLIEYFAIQKAGYQVPAEIFVTSGDIAVDATGATGAITYTVQNPVEGKKVTATTDASWITIGEQTDGSIAYTIAANEESEQRTATIILSCEGAWKNVPVQVSQAGKPSADVQTVTKTIIFANQWTNDSAVTNVTIDGISFVFAKNSGSTAPKYYTNGNAVRIYNKNSIKVSAPTGGTLTKIVMTQTGSGYTPNLSVNTGSYSISGNTGTWMGEAASVTFTNSTSTQHRMAKIEVTYTL